MGAGGRAGLGRKSGLSGRVLSLGFIYLAAKYGLGFLPPLLFWMWLRRALRDDFNPSPFQKFFIGGLVLAFPVGIGEYVLSKVIGPQGNVVAAGVVNGVLLAAIPEEISRALLLAYWVRRERGFAQPKWIIGGSIALAMGQVAIENISWIYFHTHDLGQQIQIFIARTIFTVPTLGACGLVVGVTTAWSHAHGENWMRAMGSGVLLAIVAHGIYDTSLLIGDRTLHGTALGRLTMIVAIGVMLLSYIPVHARLTELMNTQTT